MTPEPTTCPACAAEPECAAELRAAHAADRAVREAELAVLKADAKAELAWAAYHRARRSVQDKSEGAEA